MVLNKWLYTISLILIVARQLISNYNNTPIESNIRFDLQSERIPIIVTLVMYYCQWCNLVFVKAIQQYFVLTLCPMLNKKLSYVVMILWQWRNPTLVAIECIVVHCTVHVYGKIILNEVLQVLLDVDSFSPKLDTIWGGRYKMLHSGVALMQESTFWWTRTSFDQVPSSF